MTDPTTCPTCGCLVRVHTTPEGTSHYEPIRSDTAGVVIVDGDELRTGATYRLSDGRTLRLRIARGIIT
jgi:hypothetical protein